LLITFTKPKTPIKLRIFIAREKGKRKENFLCSRFKMRKNEIAKKSFFLRKGIVSGKDQPHSFTFELNGQQADTLLGICKARGFEPYSVNYTRYAFRGNGFSVAMYNSGKLVLQGKEAADFVTFTIEPQITKEFLLGNESILHPEIFRPHAGLDESGKGDFFGPLVTACVIAGGDEVKTLRKVGVKDSKSVTTDGAIFNLEKKIL
jgi:ribonuclease HIII